MRTCAKTKVSRPVVAPLAIADLMEYLDTIDLTKLPDYLVGLYDKNIITFMVTDQTFSRSRSVYGAYVDGVLCGFSIVQDATESLDLIHVNDDYREMGVASKLIEYSNIKRVVVNKKNTKALSLYQQFSLEIHYDDD